jgi:Alpha/beta hydrolase domain
MQFETETDLFGVLGFHRASQDDTDMLRTWEVAGTAHADQAILDYNRELSSDVGGGGFDLAAMCGSINQGPQAQVVRAALSALRDWVVDGTAPPEAPRLEVAGDAIARDARGIALGGIRTPGVDAPVSVLTGVAPEDRSILCMLFGDTVPFGAATIASLYPDDDDYVAAVTESADAAVEAGFLLQADADAFIEAAEEADLV